MKWREPGGSEGQCADRLVDQSTQGRASVGAEAGHGAECCGHTGQGLFVGEGEPFG